MQLRFSVDQRASRLVRYLRTISATLKTIKDTSLARIIGIYEIIWAGESFIKKGLIWPLFYTGAFYLLFSGLLTILFAKLEKKLDYFRG